MKYVPTDQKHNRRSSYESNGSRQFPHVSSAVAASCFVHIFDQTQFPDAPLCHLVEGQMFMRVLQFSEKTFVLYICINYYLLLWN